MFVVKMLKLVYNYFYPPLKRKAIPKKIKNSVWEKYHGTSFIGQCYACGKPIDKLNYHNAHVVPHIQGGLVNIDNLRTTCAHCNLQCGKQNLYHYIQHKKLKGPGSKHA
jgi:5-methylcytosine-specific restriction endonuclease McrA